MPTTIAIDPAVTDVLRRSTITADRVVLPNTLDRKLYVSVNKVLEHAGGVWNKKAKGHLFTSDPRERLGLAVENGVAQFAESVAAPHLQAEWKKKNYQQFPTPPDVAARIAKLAAVRGCVVLEPSAGEGALVNACLLAGANAVHAVEIDDDLLHHLSPLAQDVTITDFLTMTRPIAGQYSRIVMNPPFSGNRDIKHVEHALRFLAKDGILVAIMMPSTQRPAFQRLVANRDHEIHDIDAGAFEDSGTPIQTIAVKIRG